VVLKRLRDALADGDFIHAVIKGSAINNDGSLKAGYTAPSVEGQAAVIAAALASAAVEPGSIRYVEAHGTGTPLGDPIEVAALAQAFRAGGARDPSCALGSVKTNIGHLDTASGVAGLIKTALALRHRAIPPSLHFHRPNPEIDLAGRPFSVNTELRAWPEGEGPRRAGVSSFGIGGTNAHVVLEEAPALPASGPARPWQLLVLSARTDAALGAAAANLAGHLRAHPEADLADVAFTLAVGRRVLDRRRMVVCRTLEEAVDALGSDPAAGDTPPREPGGRPVVFLFPGQGTQHVNMAADVYRCEPVFRDHLDRCAEALRPELGLDLRAVLAPAGDRMGWATEQLGRTAIAQPALFAVEYALAQLWMSWGVRPRAMIGHSLGEFVAACLSGVMAPEEALALVARRAALMQEMPAGSMLAVPLPEPEVLERLGPRLSLAAVNGPGQCVVSGPSDAVESLARRLLAEGIGARRLRTSHAFHSAMMEPAIEPFRARVREAGLRPPAIPFLSNVTGTWIEPRQAVDPDYWARHLRQTVRFAEGLETLLSEPGRVLIEVGPGNTLGTIARRHPRRTAGHEVVASLPHPRDRAPEEAHLLEAAGTVWRAGVPLDWTGFYAGQRRLRLPLPTYPFQRKRYWIDPPAAGGHPAAPPEGRSDVADWFYIPSWQRTLPPVGGPAPGPHWLLFLDRCGLGAALATQLADRGIRVTLVREGARFARQDDGEFTLDPELRDDYDLLLGELEESGRTPDVIAHLWNVTPSAEAPSRPGSARDRGFYSLISLAQAIGERDRAGACRLLVISNGLHDVTGAEPLDPEKALVLGPVTVIPQEYEHLRCTSIDVDLPAEPRRLERLAGSLLAEAARADGAASIAYRGGHRWVQAFVPARLERGEPPLRPGGVYLITGGTGGVGMAIAGWLAREAPGAKIALTARSGSAPREAIDRLKGLEDLGAEVLVLGADVSDREAMRLAVEGVRRRFGAIHGVIHAAGIAGGGTIRLKDRAEAEREFAAKVEGTRVLDALLSEEPLDFFVLFSSQAGVTGGFGQVAYCAASAFQDAWAQARAARGDGTRVISVDWDRWQNLGMAVAVEGLHRELTGRERAGGMPAADALEALGRVLSAGVVPRVVVSTRDFPTLVAQSGGYQLGEVEQARPQLPLHDRPELDIDYVAPADDTQRRIAEVWRDELGIERVGVHDDFFALGGDSLVAIRLVSRLRQALGTPLTVRTLYEQPTIAALAELVATVRWAAGAEAHDFADEVEGVL
jgi:acyl transferase domain-containing protein/aryl carrier-like protein